MAQDDAHVPVSASEHSDGSNALPMPAAPSPDKVTGRRTKRAIGPSEGEESAPPKIKKRKNNHRYGRRQQAPLSVEKVVDSKLDVETLARVYLVKWRGYPASESTWEPIENLGSGAQRYLDAFHDRREKEGIFEIEEILDRKVDRETGETSYLVKWERHPGEDTWEPASIAQACPALVAAYSRRSGNVEGGKEESDHVDEKEKSSGDIDGPEMGI